MTNRARRMRGGYVFRRYPGQPVPKCLELPVPSRAVVPLAQPHGLPLQPTVGIGASVVAGRLLARDDERVCSPILAPISGTVAATDPVVLGGRTVPALMITGNGDPGRVQLADSGADWAELTVERLEALVHQAGLTTLAADGLPTRFRTSFIAPKEVSDVVLHWSGADAYNPRLDALLSDDGLARLAAGVGVFARLFESARVHVVLGRSEWAPADGLERLLPDKERVRLYRVEPRYPQDHPAVLMSSILRREFPYGYTAAHAGVIVLDLQAALHIADAVVDGKPLIDHVIALSGPSFRENVHVRARIGTPLEEIVAGRLKDGEHRLVLNSLLSGQVVADTSLPVDTTVRQIIAVPEGSERRFMAFADPGPRRESLSGAFLSALLPVPRDVSANLHGEERPCIQCGYCSSVCPAGLIPTLLNRLRRVRSDESLMRYGLFRCIDCNLCSMVCPSKIPLARNLLDTKTTLVDSGCDITRCTAPKYDLKGLEEYKGVKVTR